MRARTLVGLTEGPGRHRCSELNVVSRPSLSCAQDGWKAQAKECPGQDFMSPGSLRGKRQLLRSHPEMGVTTRKEVYWQGSWYEPRGRLLGQTCIPDCTRPAHSQLHPLEGKREAPRGLAIEQRRERDMGAGIRDGHGSGGRCWGLHFLLRNLQLQPPAASFLS